jgi:glutamine amidotransferase
MKPTVTVVDYGVGNLFSVTRALDHCGAQVVLSENPREIEAAELLLLPGVGSFANGMQELTRRGLVEALLRHARSGRKFLGICLGLQLMFDASEEFGEHAGLGLIPGKVRAIPPRGSDGRPHKIPHIGWNALRSVPQGAPWSASLLRGVPPGSSMYFVHSFTAFPEHEAHRVADCDYDGRRICAVVKRDNLHGCQFHPEKSGETGLGVLRNFLAAA